MAERQDKKKKKEKKKNSKSKKISKIKAAEEKAAKQKEACIKEKFDKWEEAWEKKCQEQDELDDYRCRLHKGLCLKPKTQSNIWVNVIEDKMTQELHMAIKQVPVPKPKPPPIPKLKRMEILSSCEETANKITKMNKKKNIVKKKKKGKKKG
ncbi:axoneme-associated protein mst101(2)-like [Vespa velutina]|uniref:axoneme-associated protein mst101(2)-like n=1 Tax=Vespa velutina TaxID=202808 RepID=UPI001FB56106|nr:axoneme-associated protein mst101(2)-like [Vespa velutina]